MNVFVCHRIQSNPKGIVLKNKNEYSFLIDFSECANNYEMESQRIGSKCVAERDITKLEYIFYTNPKTRVILKKNFLSGIFFNNLYTKIFFDIQKEIKRLGYSSYDMS